MIADGNGTNEDKRLIQLFMLINSLEDNPNDVATKSKIEIVLGQAELSFSKHLMVADACINGTEQIQGFMSGVGKCHFDWEKLFLY